jgi:hypothetical protein
MDYFILAMVCGFICAAIASSKGRSTGGWFILGALFSLLAIIIVAVLSSNKPAPAVSQASGLPLEMPEDTVRCPECRELIRADARKCKHCGSTITPAHS